MKALLDLDRWPVEVAAGGWTDRRDQGERHGPTSRPFPLASVTKPLFAYAVLVAVEEGTLDLEAPAGPEGSTVRHLLAHASGLGDDRTEALARVGRRRIYSNAGYEVLGDLLAEAAAMPYERYLHEAVVEPLGLQATVLNGSPAHAAVSTVDDLLIVLGEWLAPTLVAESTMAEATAAQFPDLGGVLPGYGSQEPNPWGLGFELKGDKSPHWTGLANSAETFGHFGRAGTFVWVDPVAGVGCVCLTNREFGPWAIEAWPRLSDSVITGRLRNR